MTKGRAILIFALICLIKSVKSHPHTGWSQHVIEKLETYVTSDTWTSGLDMDDLEQVYRESLSWDEAERKHLIESNPRYQMLHDFILVPMSRYESLIDIDSRDQQVDSKYIIRLEQNYKKLRPLYFGGVSKNRSKSLALERAYKALLGLADSKPLTKGLLLTGAASYKSHLQKLNSIRNDEDIFAHIQELEQVMSELNVKSVQVFASLIIPEISYIEDSPEDLKRLSDLFKDEMKKHGIEIVYGYMSLNNVDYSKLYELI